MPNDVVDLLEKIGQDAKLRHATDEELLRLMTLAGIAPPLRAAVVDSDTRRLGALLGARLDVCGIVVAPADEDEDSETPTDETAISAWPEPHNARSAQYRVASGT